MFTVRSGHLAIMQQIREQYDDDFDKREIQNFPPGEYKIHPLDRPQDATILLVPSGDKPAVDTKSCVPMGNLDL